MLWMLIVVHFAGPHAITWAGDFSTQEACEKVGKVWDQKDSPGDYGHLCLQAKAHE